MRLLSTVLIIAAMFILSSCKKSDSSPTSSQYSNKLELGTGMNASNFTLAGEGTAFTRSSGTAIIYYRLESANDLGGAGISIKIEKLSGSSYSSVGTYPFSNAQNYGHIIMSAFSVLDAGNYRASGLITGSITTIATATFTVQ